VHTVVVLVQDDQRNPLKDIPVEAYRGLQTTTADRIQSLVTEANGTAAFRLSIPSNGSAFTFAAGNAVTGRVVETANLLCRDTMFIVVLTGRELLCGMTVSDTIHFEHACAKSKATGVDFPDSLDHRYSSTCEEPVTVTFTTLNDPTIALEMTVFDASGNRVTGNSFSLPARGRFTVRICYSPQQEGTLNESTDFSLQGAVSTTLMRLVIDGVAIACDDCSCNNESMTIDMGIVVVGNDSSTSVWQEVNRNKTTCARTDKLIQDFTNKNTFIRTSNVITNITPNRGQPVGITFRPPGEGSFRDSMVFEVEYPFSHTTCRFTVIVIGEGVKAQCCIDELASTALAVDRTSSPTTYSIRLQADLFTSVAGSICFYNCGSGGWLNLTRQGVTNATGFTIPEERYQVQARSKGGGLACFDVSFRATDQMVWPRGRGSEPAITEFRTMFTIFGCSPSSIGVIANVDTLPALFSTCIFRWDQNRENGYNFTPTELKGSFVADRGASDPVQTMITDLVFLSGAGPALSGNVRIRSGWKLVRAGVNDQNDFTYDKVRLWPEFPTLTIGLQTSEFTTLVLYSVYVVRIEREGKTFDALIRVREINDDGQKQKLCIDVLFPL